MKRGVVNDNPAFSHHFFEIAQAEDISEVSANKLSNDIDRIMQAFEGVSDQKHRQVTSQ